MQVFAVGVVLFELMRMSETFFFVEGANMDVVRVPILKISMPL